MTRVDEIRQLWAYNRWANRRMLEAVASLAEEQFRRDMGSSFASVRDTLVHIMSAEWVWLSRLQGVSPRAMPDTWDALPLADIERAWERLDQSIREHIAGLDESHVDEPVSYTSTAGEPYVSTRAQIVRHVVNHSTYHRGQITTLLRQLGVSAPATDLIVFYRAEVAVPVAH